MDLETVQGVEPTSRRLWLLLTAAKTTCLSEALKIAKEAEGFILGNTTDLHVSEVAPVAETASSAPIAALTITNEPAVTAKKARSSIPSEKNEEIQRRIRAGETNAEIGRALNLEARQVQGIRMGLIRQNKKKTTASNGSNGAHPEPSAPPEAGSRESTVGMDDVVRYLRQQDDVVVREGEAFVINGRQRLTPAEVINRANRIRTRFHLPEFRLSF